LLNNSFNSSLLPFTSSQEESRCSFNTLDISSAKYPISLRAGMPVIPSIGEVEIGRIVVQGKWGKKLMSLHLKKTKLGVVAHTCSPSHAGNVGRRIIV
jgi:hypothetical protein